MPFTPEDLYTVSAGVELYNYWNPFVTKHDSSSFYNYEQDNLPLHDLEERSDFLWERFGWPTSSLPGLALCVSSSSSTENNNVFTSLSAAVDALPEIIRQPTLIEVATSGDLGTLELKNIKCVGEGKLEIVNRVYASIDRIDGANTVLAVGSTTGRKAIATVSSGDFFETVRDTSALSVSHSTSALFGNGTIAYDGVSFVTQTTEGTGPNFRPDQLSVNFHADSSNHKVLDNAISSILVGDINSISVSSDVQDSASALDFSATGGGQTLQRTSYTGFTTGANCIGIFTNNTLNSVKLYNCDGPIYLRGFAVQGANGVGPTPTYYEDYGISIKNCNDVIIENCGVTRSKVGGMYVSNSDVTLNRRFFSGRNYDTNRSTTTNYGLKAHNSTITLASDTYSNGLDSVFMFYQHDYGIYLADSQLVGGDNPTASVSKASLRTCYNAESGIKMVNSVVDLDCHVDSYTNKIGIDCVASELTVDTLICQYNEEVGLKSESSKINYAKNPVNAGTTIAGPFAADGIKHEYTVGFHGNGIHLDLYNSKYSPSLTDELDASCGFSLFAHNIGEDALAVKPGINLNNSKATLVHSRISTVGEGDIIDHIPQFTQNPAVPAYGAAISAKSKSEVELLGSYNLATVITGPKAQTRRDSGLFVDGESSCRISGPFFIGQFGVPIYAVGASKVDFCPHTEEGANGFALSSFDLTGQTGNHTSVEVHAYGPCMVADSNSVINMRDLGDAFAKYPADEQVSDYPTGYHADISAYMHAGSMMFMPNPNTAVATGANLHDSYASPSKIEYFNEPRGNYRFTGGTMGNGDYNYYLANNATLNANQGTVTRGGVCVQALGNSVVNVNNVTFNAVSSIGDGVYYDALESPSKCSEIRIWSFGGGATLNCNHVAVSGTYPSLAGYHGPEAVYYDESDANGYMPSSIYKEAFKEYPYGYEYGISSISGTDFRTAGAPSGGADPLTGKVGRELYYGTVDRIAASGSNPHVSGLSVLDAYGAGNNIYTTFTGLTTPQEAAGGTGNYLPTPAQYYQVDRSNRTSQTYNFTNVTTYNGTNWWGRTSYENTGPFRLYLEPDPFAHKLRYLGASSLNDNRIYQAFSQGYHASGTMSATVADLSTWDATKALTEAAKVVGEGSTSAIYCGVEDVVRPENYNIKLDESASHAFANAKHCSTEFLGRPKMVDIYRGTLGQGGALNENAGSGEGAGFKSPHTFDLRRNY
jgi:hypothetical protein